MLGINISPEAVAFIGILLACILRTTIPYVFKHKDDNTINFQVKYVLSFVLVVIGGGVAAILVFPMFSIPATSLLNVFALAFGFGWASDDILNKIITWITPTTSTS